MGRGKAGAGDAVSIGLGGNAAEVFPGAAARIFQADVVTDQTSAHGHGRVLPAGLFRPGGRPAEPTPRAYQRGIAFAPLGEHVEAMVGFLERAAVVFDYGNNLRPPPSSAPARRLFP